MRIVVIVAGLTLSLTAVTAVTAASSATQPLAGTGIAASDSASKQAGLVMAAASTGMVPKHHPHYHHYKHHYRSHMKAGHGKS
jgi:hypothetical protein